MPEATRPTRGDRSVRDAAIAILAKECADWPKTDLPADDWAEVLKHVNLNGNGFDIAKDVERFGRVYDVDLELVEILDGASHCLWDAHGAAVRKWAAENGVKPDRAVGDRIGSPYGNGVISAVREDQAIYLLVPDGETERYTGGGGIHVAYEAATDEQVPA